jgi:hypothetical protein
MVECLKEYDYKRLLIDCGLSSRRAESLQGSLRAAIKRQEAEMNIEHVSSGKTKIKETIDKPNKVKKADINEVLDPRSDKDKE